MGAHSTTDSASSPDEPEFVFVAPTADDDGAVVLHAPLGSGSPRLTSAIVECVEGKSDVALFPSIPTDSEDLLELADQAVDAKLSGALTVC